MYQTSIKSNMIVKYPHKMYKGQTIKIAKNKTEHNSLTKQGYTNRKTKMK
jgi:hypothetical protein